MKIFRVVLNPTLQNYMKDFSAGNLGNCKCDRQKFDHNFYSKMPIRLRFPTPSIRKIFVLSILERFHMVPKKKYILPDQYIG